MARYRSGVRCYVPGCANLCHIGKVCGQHWKQIPLHLRPAVWNGDMTEALKFFDRRA